MPATCVSGSHPCRKKEGGAIRAIDNDRFNSTTWLLKVPERYCEAVGTDRKRASIAREHVRTSYFSPFPDNKWEATKTGKRNFYIRLGHTLRDVIVSDYGIVSLDNYEYRNINYSNSLSVLKKISVLRNLKREKKYAKKRMKKYYVFLFQLSVLKKLKMRKTTKTRRKDEEIFYTNFFEHVLMLYARTETIGERETIITKESLSHCYLFKQSRAECRRVLPHVKSKSET